MIALQNVHIRFGDRTIFENVSHTFPAGQITTVKKTGVLDGSSTLLKCLAGIEQPTAGDILWKGEKLSDLSERDRYQRLSYCFENGGLVSLFTIYNNIALPLTYHRIYPDGEVAGRIHLVAQQLGIEHLLDQEPHQLNDVQIRLVNLARALVLQAEAILVDEIQTGMSETMLENTVNILLEQAHLGRTIVMVTTSGDEDSFAHHHLMIQDRTLREAE